MGRRGPAKKPSVIEIAEGRPGKRRVNFREPTPAQITQEETRTPPAHLSPAAQKWWVYYADILRGLKVLTEADLMALENLATATAERIKYEAQLDQAGALYESRTKVVKVSPLFSVVDRLKIREFQLLREFGMTPSSRTNVQMTPANAGRNAIEDAMYG